jgi:amidohydrolase
VRRATRALLLASGLLCAPAAARAAQPVDLEALILAGNDEVVRDRRHFHQYPELSNRETQTSAYVARELGKLGIEVRTGVARTGVVGVLKGGMPGPVVALRADMDALPVVEEADLPFRSTVRTTYDGKEVGIMHACGHDSHMAMLLGSARVLAAMREQLPGTVKFLFQPAEEGAPAGERPAGAEAMVAAGVMRDAPKPDVVFGLHVFPGWEVGKVAYRAGAMMASSDSLEITVDGKQTHGAYPWAGVDPIVAASQIVLGLQTVVSRQMEIRRAPVIVTIGKIEGGVRGNIIPDRVVMKGTLRALDEDMRAELHRRVERTAVTIADSSGASAEVRIGAENAYPVTRNDPALTAKMLPALERELGPGNVIEIEPVLGAEDFSFFANEVPGLFVFLGVRTPGSPAEDWAANHSPRFRLDEAALPIGVRTLTTLTLDYLSQAATAAVPADSR